MCWVSTASLLIIGLLGHCCDSVIFLSHKVLVSLQSPVVLVDECGFLFKAPSAFPCFFAYFSTRFVPFCDTTFSIQLQLLLDNIQIRDDQEEVQEKEETIHSQTSNTCLPGIFGEGDRLWYHTGKTFWPYGVVFINASELSWNTRTCNICSGYRSKYRCVARQA